MPQHQTPTFLPFIFATVVMPLSFQVSSVMPLLENTCAMLMIFLPPSRKESMLGTQSIPNSACLPSTTCSGVIVGPPTFRFTSSPAFE